MLFKNSHRRNAAANPITRRRPEHSRSGRRLTFALDQTRIAQAFYCDVLRGRQVWDSERAGTLSFIVHGTRIDVVTNARADGEPVVLSVGDPEALAERCWDAGYSVRVGHETEAAPTVSVIDPFGRRIELVR